MPDIGYLNGRFSLLEKITISPDDRGFLFGDGIYEVVRAYHGVPAFWREHFTRLIRSAKEIRLPYSNDPEEFHQLLLTGIHKSGYANVKIYFQLTRGVAPREHGFPVNAGPTTFMSFREMSPLPMGMIKEGVKVVTVPDIRWNRCDIKSLNLLPNVLAKQQAQDAQAFEAIFVRDGLVIEGATSNIFIAKDGQLFTPERNNFVLAGVTQHYVVDLAQSQCLQVQFVKMPLDALYDADEVFLVGTTIEVLPVVKVNDQIVQNGRPGSMTRALQKGFENLVSNLSEEEPIN